MLVDTSIWVDHLRRGNAALVRKLSAGEVWCHAFVIGELACGTLRRRDEVLSLLAALPRAPIAEHREVLAFVDAHALMGLMGRGIGWIDAHLLASATLGRLPLWTADKRLASAANRLGVSTAIGRHRDPVESLAESGKSLRTPCSKPARGLSAVGPAAVVGSKP